MYRWFIQPIRLIVGIMKRVDEEGMELRMPNMDNMGEYHIVGSAFNSMMEKISRLKIDVYEKEKKKQELYEQCSRPVSYTHLDVYKRQGWKSWLIRIP